MTTCRRGNIARLPQAAAAAIVVAFSSPASATTDGAMLYAERCASCHGPLGAGDGPAAANLTPRPRTLADPRWQVDVSDAHLRDVILRGGTVVLGRPSGMPAHPDLDAEQVGELVAHVRRLGGAKGELAKAPPATWRITSRTWGRLAKFYGLALFAAGLVGVVVARARRVRLSMLYRLALPGFVSIFAGGWLLMRASGRALTTPWLATGALAGACAIHLAFLASHLERPRRVTSMLTWGCASAALAVMVARFEQPFALTLVAAVGLVAGTLAAVWVAPSEVHLDDADEAAAYRGLVWLARLEGATLLLLLAVSMPLRLVGGMSLDGGSGVLGWVHGVLFLLYLQALSSNRKVLHLPASLIGVGIAAALVPGGTFWFERRLNSEVGVWALKGDAARPAR